MDFAHERDLSSLLGFLFQDPFWETAVVVAVDIVPSYHSHMICNPEAGVRTAVACLRHAQWHDAALFAELYSVACVASPLALGCWLYLGWLSTMTAADVTCPLFSTELKR